MNILKEVFKINNGQYNNKNMYWKSFNIIKKINLLKEPEKNKLKKKLVKINDIYNNLSIKYQKTKINNQIPLN